MSGDVVTGHELYAEWCAREWRVGQRVWNRWELLSEDERLEWEVAAMRVRT
jgi:hypothetical protein